MKNKLSIKIYIIAFILCSMVCLLFIGSFKSGMCIQSNNGIRKYNSLTDLMNKTSLNIELPNYVVQQSKEEDLTIESIMGQVVQIYGSSFAFKAATFVNNNADPLGLYEKAETDSKYSVETTENENKNSIKFFRYRLGYEEYSHCTLINWCTDETAYGLMISNIITEDEAIEIIGIEKERLTEYIEKTEQESESTENKVSLGNEYTISDNFKVTLPKFNSELNMVETENSTLFYIEDKLVFVFVYGEDDGAFNGQSERKIINGLVLKYLSDNPFNNESDGFNDYNLFIDTIDDIIDSIVYI